MALMSSPALMHEQVQRWLNNRKNRAEATIGDIDAIKKEIEKLKIEEDRYNRAYGAGIFTVEKLSEYSQPIKERLKNLNSQIIKIQQEKSLSENIPFPDAEQIKTYAAAACQQLHD